MAKKTKKWEGKCRNCRVQLKEGFLICLTKRKKKKEKRKTSLLIYFPPRNSSLNIRSYFFIKEIIVFLYYHCVYITLK